MTPPGNHDNPGVPPTSTVSLVSVMPDVVPSQVRAREAGLAEILASPRVRGSTWQDDSPGQPVAAQAGSPQAGAVDCGGAVYSANTSLRLIENAIVNSQASRTRDGYGGGACIVIAPAGGVGAGTQHHQG